MAKRLVVSREPTADSHIIPGVPSPWTFPGGRWEFVRCLAVALPAAELWRAPGDAYDCLMALTGCGFVVPVVHGFAPPGRVEVPQARVTEALEDLCLRAEWHTPAGEGPEVVDWARQATSAGRPMLLRGWLRASDGWGVITGYDIGRGVLCGWPAEYEGESYLGAPPAGDMALCLSQDVSLSGPDDEQIPLRALRWALSQTASLTRRYAAWRKMLGDRDLWRAEEEAAGERAVRQDSTLELLADARQSVQRFLGGCASVVAETAEEWLLEARECYERLLERVEGRDPRPTDEDSVAELLSREWRRAWTEQLREIEALDLKALDCVRRALSPNAPAPHEDYLTEEAP